MFTQLSQKAHIMGRRGNICGRASAYWNGEEYHLLVPLMWCLSQTRKSHYVSQLYLQLRSNGVPPSMQEKICILGSIYPIIVMDSIHIGTNHHAIQLYHCLVLLKFFCRPLQCCFWAPTCTTLKPSLKSVLCNMWTMQTVYWTFTLTLKTGLIPEDELLFWTNFKLFLQ